jgi:maleate cis-trans isomerase
VDSDGAHLIAQFPGVVLRQTKCAMAGEEICSDSFIGAYDSGMLSHSVESLRFPIGYNTMWGIACTSMSFLLGPERCDALFAGESDGNGGTIPYTDMMSAVIGGLKAVTNARAAANSKGRRRIAVLTPYIREVHLANLDRIRAEGFQVTAAMNLGFERDELTSALSPESIAHSVEALVAGAGGPDKVDAVFVGCSAFRAMGPGFISKLEATIGVTVVTSMQAFFWHMLRRCDVDDQVDGYGRLFLEH